jgi:hypothetical protein
MRSKLKRWLFTLFAASGVLASFSSMGFEEIIASCSKSSLSALEFAIDRARSSELVSRVFLLMDGPEVCSPGGQEINLRDGRRIEIMTGVIGTPGGALRNFLLFELTSKGDASYQYLNCDDDACRVMGDPKGSSE